jgi:hypothetical protein
MRGKSIVKQKDKKIDNFVPGWERALQEAERQILMHRRSIVQLRGSVEIFKRKIATGEPWPGQVQESDRKRHANG